MSQDSPTVLISGQMKGNEIYEDFGNKTEARVLVLFTGGTIGMLRNDKNGKC